MIEDLITRVMNEVGLSDEAARGGTGLVFALLQKFGDAGAIAELFEAVPGVAELAAAQRGALETGGGGLAGMEGVLGKIVRGQGVETMKALSAFQSLGVDLDQAKGLVRVVSSFVGEHAGEGAREAAFGEASWLKAFL